MKNLDDLRSLTPEQRSDIAAYLGKPNFPLATLLPSSFTFSAIAIGATSNRTFRLSNSGDADLIVTGGTINDNINFRVNDTACKSAAVKPGGSCDVVVTFQPQSAAAFNGLTLTINHNTFAASSIALMSGTGLAPFTVSPAALSYTPSTAPSGAQTVTITDNTGDRLQICRVAAATFSAPSDFSLDAPFTLGTDGCFTAATTTTLPRTLALNVRFAPGAIGPRNGALRVRRVDAGGNPLVGTATLTVQLTGNPGPLATVNASSLFDASVDPGVEVDGDNVLERSFTLFSQGSDPLIFSVSSFTLAGPGSSEYKLAGTGCQTLAQLPAYVSGGTVPSCVLTVHFNPSDVGRRGPATLSTRIAGTTDNSISLNGLGIRGPRLVVRRAPLPLASGDSLQFGTQTQGGLYPPIRLTLSNGGTVGDLQVVLPATGTVAGFRYLAGAGCANLPPSAECNVDLRFDPAAAQAYASTFAIQTRPSGTSSAFGTFALTLLGQGTAQAVPVLGWTDTAGTPIVRLDFPDANVGTPHTARVRLYNDGPGGVNLQLMNAIGLDAVNFRLDSTACANGRDLFEKSSCELVVLFAPETAGLKAASLQSAAHAGTTPLLVVAPALPTRGTAIAVAPPPVLRLSTSELGFTKAVAGSLEQPLELRLSNTGNRTLEVSGFDATAPFLVTVKTCPGVPFTLSPGSECTLSVSFQPQVDGDAAGILRITSSADPAVQQVTLNGQAVPAPDVSGGGCSIAQGDAATDPTLWTLLLLATAVLFQRRRCARRKALEP